MGALFVVLELEAIERTLLSTEARARRLGGLGLQGAVHAFMPSVLIRPTRQDTLGSDPQPDPPDRESREPPGRERRERRAVVGPDRARQAMLAEHGLEDALGAAVQRTSQGSTAQQVATEPIADRQRVATLAVTPTADREASFEVGTPDRVRRIVLAQTLPVRGAAPDASTRTNQPVPLQDVADGARGGQHDP